MSRTQLKDSRQLFHQPAFIDAGDGTPPRQCTITDISKTGARILMNFAHLLPAEFSLVMTRHGNVRRHCHVTWHSDGEVGVMFVHTPKSFQAFPMFPTEFVETVSLDS